MPISASWAEYKEKLRLAKEELLALVFPKICIGCKKALSPRAETYLCADCYEKIAALMKPPFCISCGRPVDVFGEEGTGYCAECARNSFNFSRGFTALSYDGFIKDCIHDFKYNAHTYLAKTFADCMIRFAGDYIELSKIDMIIPVPLHPKRLRDRGFNQVELIARELGRRWNIPVGLDNLARTKNIPSQVDLPRKERLANVKGAFSLVEQNEAEGLHFLLIDDVYTTGATLDECAGVLKDAGAKDVWVFSLAHGSR